MRCMHRRMTPRHAAFHANAWSSMCSATARAWCTCQAACVCPRATEMACSEKHLIVRLGSQLCCLEEMIVVERVKDLCPSV